MTAVTEICPRCRKPWHTICTKPEQDPLREAVPPNRRPPSEPLSREARRARFDRYMDEARARWNPPPTETELRARNRSKSNQSRAKIDSAVATLRRQLKDRGVL